MELLVRIRDKVSEDFHKNIALTKRGDVIVVMPDGHDWGIEELANPDWRIIRVPVSRVEAEAMVAHELKQSEEQDKRLLQRRAFKFDLDSLDKASLDWLADDSRKVPFLSLSAAAMRAIKIQKPVIADHNIIGGK